MSPKVTAAIGRTFSSVRTSRNFRLYLFGQTVSAIGTWMNFTASAWLVLQLTDSGTALGANIALYFLPVLLLGAYGGVLADRFDKRHILMATQAAYGVVALTLWVLVATDVAELWMVYVLSLASGVVTAIDNPSRQSFYIEMVGEEHVRNAVSLNSAAFTGSRIFGPAIAGVLIATVGIATCFLIDGISYAAVLIALFAMRPAELHPQKRSTRERGHLVAGLKYVWATDELRRPLIAMAVVFTVSFNFAVFVPLLAERTFDGDAGTFGALSALAGIGSFVGAIVMASRVAEPRMRDLALWAVAAGVSPRAPRPRAHALVRGRRHDPHGLHDHGVHDHRQHDAAAEREARGAGPGHGALRHRLPGLDPDRRSDRRCDRRAPGRARGVRDQRPRGHRAGLSPCSRRDVARSAMVRRRRTRDRHEAGSAIPAR